MNILYIFAGIFGLLAHICLFIHGEWHIQAPQIFLLEVIGATALIFQHYLRSNSIQESICETFVLTSVFHTTMLSSILIYRICFHRLHRFPGPVLASATKFWHVWYCLDSRNYLVLENLRKRYGDVVRTGPNELTLFSPDFLKHVDGPGSRCDKAVWYDLLLPEIAVNTTRSRQLHDQRRRIWDRGFSPKALEYYQERVVVYAKQLDDLISKAAASQTPLNISIVFYWFTFDVMGEFAFGKSFDMLTNGKWHFAVILLRKAMRLLGPLTPVPWLAQIGIVLFPWLWVVRDWLAMLEWCRDRMRERIKNGSTNPDVAHWLIKASAENESLTEDLPWLYGDAVTIIIAGSDTAAPTLVHLFYELASDSSRCTKLRAEIDKVDIFDHRALESCEYLNGIINETLRLHPPVPTHGYRITPPEGLQIGETYIPGSVTIVTPQHSFGRLESCYSKPNAFIPERWSSEPQLIKDRRVFKPFGQGRYGCVGKSLALRELRFVVSLLVQRYDTVFAPGEDGSAVLKEKKDYFTAAPGPLNLNFIKRGGKNA